jgi:hypothetical protein
VSRCSGHLHGALEGGLGSHGDGDGFSLGYIAKAHVGGLRLSDVGFVGIGEGGSSFNGRMY